MIKLTLNEIAEIVNGEVINGDGTKVTSANPVINSQQASSETFFVAFVGEKVDGHEFIGASCKSSTKEYISVNECTNNCADCRSVPPCSKFFSNVLEHIYI